jgi:Ohr subfamily peroxiredoxin
LYTATATVTGGREGHVRSSDGVLDHALSMPRALGGSGGPGTNPEQLFAAGYAACFESAVRLVARLRKAPLTDASITANVTLNKTPENLFELAVELRAKLVGVPPADARALLDAAHEICPYSRATRGNITVTLVAD